MLSLIAVAVVEIVLIGIILYTVKLILADPSTLKVAGPGLAWTVVFALLFGYSIYLSAKKNVWSKALYSENLTECLAKLAEKELSKKNFKYKVCKSIFYGYKFDIFCTEKSAEEKTETGRLGTGNYQIIIRSWLHIKYLENLFQFKPRTGTVIHIKPHPSKASEEFKEVVRYVLLGCGLVEWAAEWY